MYHGESLQLTAEQLHTKSSTYMAWSIYQICYHSSDTERHRNHISITLDFYFAPMWKFKSFSFGLCQCITKNSRGRESQGLLGIIVVNWRSLQLLSQTPFSDNWADISFLTLDVFQVVIRAPWFYNWHWNFPSSISVIPPGIYYLTNRFHVAVRRLFSNRSQVTSKKSVAQNCKAIMPLTMP